MSPSAGVTVVDIRPVPADTVPVVTPLGMAVAVLAIRSGPVAARPSSGLVTFAMDTPLDAAGRVDATLRPVDEVPVLVAV